MEQALSPGARIGSYEVIDRLGTGGMGEVYRARDTRLGRTVALKVLRPDADPELLHRLDREARAASGLNHPNIVHVYDVGEAAGQAGAHYVVMEHVEGETLRRSLARGPLPIAQALDLGAQLSDGLAKAHRAGIIHRDLKPENLMITADGQLKILDFGLAKVVAAPLADMDGKETLSRHGTQVGMLLGTLEYMSPEQASGRPVDHRTDQFALGLILWEMLVGRPVFRRDTPAQVLAAVIEREPEPLERWRADVPAALGALVNRCLHKDPTRRYAKTDELAAELASLAGRARTGSLAPLARAEALAVAPIVVDPMAMSSAPPAPERVPSVYHVQTGDRVQSYDENKLVRLLRRQKLSGAELVRYDDDDRWRPLYESSVYRREVPTGGDPQRAAGERALRGVFGHFSSFLLVSGIMFFTQGHFPFWLGIWGVVLAVQALGTAPAAWTLLRQRRLEAAAAPAMPAAPAAPRLPAPAAATVPSVIAREGTLVRGLIQQRGGTDAQNLLAEVDGIVKLTADLTTRMADLEEQTSERERAALATAVSEAEARLARAELVQDRNLFERQLKIVRGREEAIAKAVRVLERLRVRREMAEHQLKQLRLDLSRGAAGGLDIPELSSRLQFIRYEVDAQEDIDEMDARRA